MPPNSKFDVSAMPVYWPSEVRIHDLWDHDICAIFALVPEFMAAVTIRPTEAAVRDAYPFRRLLFKSSYWPAVIAGGADICVPIDECIRKMCSISSLYFDPSTYEIKNCLATYWPVLVGRQEHQKQLQVVKKRREAVRRGTAQAQASASAPPNEHPYAFNRCRRSDGSAFWLTPYIKFNDIQTKTAIPKTLSAQLEAQAQAVGSTPPIICPEVCPTRLASLYPHLYMDPADRVTVLARQSLATHTDAIGDYRRHKSELIWRRLNILAE